MQRFPPTKTVAEPDDWLVDIEFRGLKTGRVIKRRVGVSGNQPEDGAILWAWHLLKITDLSRVVSCHARRRVDVQTMEEAGEVTDWMRLAAQQFARGLA